MIEIKSKSGEVLHIIDADTLVGANLQSLNLSEASFKNQDMRGCNLSSSTLYQADLRGANLYDAFINHANIKFADLRKVNFNKAYLAYSSLYSSDLRHADFSEAKLMFTNFQYADLRGANFFRAKLAKADFREAKLSNDFIVISGLPWPVSIFRGWITIGCESHSRESWENFDDQTIRIMDFDALTLWKKYKRIILDICDSLN